MSLFSTNHVAGLARITPAPINSLAINHSPRWRAYQKGTKNYDTPCTVGGRSKWNHLGLSQPGRAGVAFSVPLAGRDVSGVVDCAASQRSQAAQPTLSPSVPELWLPWRC